MSLSEDWDLRYRQGNTPWCKGLAHPLLPDAALPAGYRGRLLVPGCGRGSDVTALAFHAPAAEIIGIDLSPSAVREARARCAAHPGVRFEVADFLATEEMVRKCGTVERIWEHTCFCALPPSRRPDYVRSVARLLDAGGMLCGVFFLTMEDGGQGPPWNCPIAELTRLFSEWFEIAAPESCTRTFPGREGEEYLVRMTRNSQPYP